jgi:arylsulfatase A-like enzyme
MPNDGVQREVLPIPEIPPVGLTTYDAKDPATSYPPITPLRPPAGAPNLLVVLLDDVGFGAASVFGGPCQTPTFERLASNGLRYTRFHTTSLCSPTRAALLSGRNHHSVGMGGITEIATAAPGYSSLRPNTKATVRETIAWVRQQTALTPDKPFFAYFAPGATHAPHHVPTEWADRYRGRFDDGWDALRERIFARQKELGVIPQDAADASARRDPGLGRHGRAAQAGAGPPDGGLRRVPGAHRPPRRPPPPGPGGAGGAGGHPGLCDRGRQRRQR